MRVLVTPHLLRNLPGTYRDILEGGGFEVVYPTEGFDTYPAENITRLLSDCDAMVASTEPLTRAVLSQTKRVRCIARMGVGFDWIEIPAATDLKIAVTITPGTLEESAAEHTVALMLGVTRDLVRRDREVRTAKWERIPYPRMAGRTFGVIGLGRIGRAVVPKVQGLGMNVIAHDPFVDRAWAASKQIGLVPLDELFATADVISVHSPATPETTDFINARSLGLMKQGAVFINTSRGATVDEDALCAALHSGRLLGAALDVFKREPLPLESPLLNCPNLLLCSHMAGLDSESTEAMGTLAAKCIVELSQNRWPEGYVVNHELREGWQW